MENIKKFDEFIKPLNEDQGSVEHDLTYAADDFMKSA